MEQHLIQHPLEHPQFTISATECLNLNITVPDTDQEKLAVFVFIHGGGFATGANCWPQYDLARIVRCSANQGIPVIGVTINYRLGAPGFLSSNEMTTLGFPPNRGLSDQRLALKWIKTYVSGFGGDPNNITVIGQSAGGVSALMHLDSPDPLFEKVISMGGTPFTLKPLKPSVAESTYSSVLTALGITGSSPQERTQKLLNVSPAQLYRGIPHSLPLSPVLDGDIIKHDYSYDSLSRKQHEQRPGEVWCRSLLIGDCKHDASILTLVLGDRMKTLSQDFLAFLETSFAQEPNIVAQVLQLYPMDNKEPEVATTAVLNFFGDLLFFAPTVKISQAWPKQAYVYRFNHPNPWFGPWNGEANHIFDVASLFLNYEDFLPEGEAKSHSQMTLDFLNFICGNEPFPRYEKEAGGVRVYGPPSEGFSFRASFDGALTGRRTDILVLEQEVSLDRLSRVCESFMSGTALEW
ncbi:hypothetical protein HJFPF1_11035 [Paramyrothecium foliicola]|nr:hypothetical protein HJFPF1_11035 [Paramyrothecium foliicola]